MFTQELVYTREQYTY